MTPPERPPGAPPGEDGHEPGWLSREVAAMAAAWERGEAVTASQVIARHPGLDTESAIRLIYEEASLRREAGEPVDTTEVVRRYPRWGDELRALFDCDRLLRPSGAVARFPEVGETLGTFLLLSELGRGASGRTYLATDPTLADRPVVVKVISDDQDEHLALARLRHTHIVPLFSEHAFPGPGLRVLCMPYLGGSSLAQVLDDLAGVPVARRSGKTLVEAVDRHTRATPSPLPTDSPFRRSLEQASYVEAMTWIGACLADALQYAHARGLVHMDIKPSNVLITADGQPMLLDFHLARAPIRAEESVTDRLGGTPGWMSPEQAAAMEAVVAGEAVPAAVDGRSDIFALGLLLREALGASAPGERTAVRPPVGMSVGLADILRKCLAPAPGDRYPDAATLAEDLRRELADLPLSGVRNRSPRERWRKWRRRHPGSLAWIITGLAVLLAAGVAAGAYAGIYRQRVGQVRLAIEEAGQFRANGRYAEAIEVLRRGRTAAGGLPAAEGLKAGLDRELRLAERGQTAEELHRLADLVRFRFGIDPPPPDQARSLVRLCRVLWERRGHLAPVDGASLGAASEARVRTDLLEVAALWADLLVRLAPPSDAGTGRRDALHILDEATAALGPSYLIDDQRARLGDAVAPHPPARNPRSASEHYDLGRSHLRSGDLRAAASEFRRTLDLRPQDFWSNFYDGLCAFRLGRYDDAVAAFRACLALVPQSAPCRFNRALALEALGRADEAYRDYTAALALDPDLAPALLNRGILAYKAGRPADAITDFERALRLPADRETLGRLHYNLALAHLARGARASARTHADHAARLGNADVKSLRPALR